MRAGFMFALLLAAAPTSDTAIGISFSTFLGGSNRDFAYAVAVDPAGNVYVTGYASSTDFPTLNALCPKYAGGEFEATTAYSLSSVRLPLAMLFRWDEYRWDEYPVGRVSASS